MEFKVENDHFKVSTCVFVVPVFTQRKKEKSLLDAKHLPKELLAGLKKSSNATQFFGEKGQSLIIHNDDGQAFVLVGLGEKPKVSRDEILKEVANLAKHASKKYDSIGMCLDSFNCIKDVELTARTISEAFYLARYHFDKYLQKKAPDCLKKVVLVSKHKAKKAKILKAIEEGQGFAERVNTVRNFGNEPPNVLNSEVFASEVVKDAKKALKGKNVKTKVLGREELKKQKMNLFLSVNLGSAYEPRLVQLSYTPKKVTSKTRHVVLVGKGLTFDTGGLSIKPSQAMVSMKYDMMGAATVYGAFRAAVLANSKNKITCLLGITDNHVSNTANLPDAVVVAKNGLSVEILNTDAEGRLVLADCLSYACDLKPHAIINAATLTGAILIALGNEVCGLFSNNSKLASSLLESADKSDEHLWKMPIVEEYRKDLKSPIADLKNIGQGRSAGSAKAAAFLEHFVSKGVPWAHLDIAGVATDQNHLSYCPPKGASGVMVRTLANYLCR